MACYKCGYPEAKPFWRKIDNQWVDLCRICWVKNKKSRKEKIYEIMYERD